MIKYALECVCGSTFDAWFSSSDSYDLQAERGLVECPACGGHHVTKQIMAPAVRDSKHKNPAPVSPRTGKPDMTPEQFAQMASHIRKEIASTHDYVGDDFADQARAMYYGEKDAKPVWGQTTPEQAKELVDEGIPALPLPKAFAPPVPISKEKSKLN